MVSEKSGALKIPALLEEHHPRILGPELDGQRGFYGRGLAVDAIGAEAPPPRRVTTLNITAGI